MGDDPACSTLADAAIAQDLRRGRRTNPDVTLSEIEAALGTLPRPAWAALLGVAAGDVGNGERGKRVRAGIRNPPDGFMSGED